MDYFNGTLRLWDLKDLSENILLTQLIMTTYSILLRNIQNFEAILVNIITSPTFTEELFITSDDIALSARPVRREPTYNTVSVQFALSR